MNLSKKRFYRPRFETLEERAVPAALPFVVPHNGVIIPHVQVSTVYFGDAWSNVFGPNYAELQAEKNDFNQFYSVVANSAFMDGLGQYVGHTASLDPIYSFIKNSQPGLAGFLPTIAPGRGKFVGSDTVTGNLSAGDSIPTSTLTAMLTQEITAHALAQPTDDRLYVVYLPPGVQLDGGIAFHNSFTINGQNVFFAAVTHVGDQAWRPDNMTDFQAMTTISSHELVEAVTDPILNQGYVDDTPPAAWSGPQEISDLGNDRLSHVPGFENYSQFALSDGYVVQQYWSNQAGHAVGGTPIKLTADSLLTQTIPTMPNFSGASFTLHGVPRSIDMQFLQRVLVDGTHANYPVLWGNRSDTHAFVAINGDRLDVTISGADNSPVFQGYMEAPGGDWLHHKELSGSIYTGGTNANRIEYVFGLQQGFHIFHPGEFDGGPVSAGPFGMAGRSRGFNSMAALFGMFEVLETVPPGVERRLLLDLDFLSWGEQIGFMSWGERWIKDDLFAEFAALQATTPTRPPTTPPTTTPPTTTPPINQGIDFT